MSLFIILRQAATALLGHKAAPSQPAKVHVGTGGDNEFQIHISGVPHLFRDEGDRVVHFRAEFQRLIHHTAFGDKVLPEVVPRWIKVGVHDAPDDTPQSVAEKVVRDARLNADARAQNDAKAKRPRADTQFVEEVTADDARQPRGVSQASSSTYTVGTLVEWGEMEFPNRKPDGKRTYKSFAVKLDTGAGIKTLQGEGLKDVLADARCKVGERVGIKRLHKEKVPAFDHLSGRPIKDKATGEQKLWDRWVWSINRIH
ncbi:hypothetical protein [Cupriavidus agavae]|uniref:Uncharacterized protein n=1 Tax=Cupriavidus agavae TaxID=1001822 RepID=A0A4Q7RNV3_9BURK|nr:hypothetical protein [Cupriavidus agavae]RZT35395.1 hypothetical protein EV147_3831 [Cupriavidus agavae]